jgi:hypothetical protein
MRLFIVSMFFVGIIMSVVGYYKANTSCPIQKVKYKFIPKTLEEEQADQVSVSATFRDMFTKSAPKDKL